MQLALLDKIARNCEMLGLTVNAQTGTAVVIENGSNDLTISLLEAEIQAPMGGVSHSVSPFLGIGISAGATILVKSAVSTADTIADVIDGDVAAKVLKMLGGFANDVRLENSDAAFVLVLRGHPDYVGLGQYQ